MRNITVGSLIEKARKEQKKITRKKLVRGLCSEQALFAIETSQSDADVLMADVLLQRLGKSPDKLEVILSLDTYLLVRRRDLIEAMIMKGKRSTAKSMLDAYPLKTRLDKMYYHRMNACLLYRVDKDYDGALKELDTAIQLTLPEFTYEKMDEYLISTMEMENLLARERLLYEQEENKNKIIQRDNLELCMQYIDDHFTDEEEHAKICAKCSWLLARYFYDTGNMMKAMVTCEKGIEGLRSNTMIYFMYPLLELMVKITEAIGITEEKNRWIKYYETMIFLWDKYAKKWYPKDLLFHNCYQKEYYLDYELIKTERIARNIKQEDLIEGIYQNPESLSRMENGKASPNKNTFDKLMKRLELNRGRYNGFVVTDSFEIMELRRKIDRCVSKDEYSKALDILDKIKLSLDLCISDNEIVTSGIELLINSNLKLYSEQEKAQKWGELIKRIFGSDDFESLSHVPTRNEAIWLNIYCITLIKCDDGIKAEALYKQAINCMHNSLVDSKYRYRSYSLLKGNYSEYMKNLNELDDMICFELYCGKASMITHLVIYYARIINENDENQEDVIKYSKIIYYLSSLYYFEKIKSLFNDFLIKKKEVVI